MENSKYHANKKKSLGRPAFRGCILAATAIILPTGCGWVDSTGSQDTEEVSFQAALPGEPGVIDLFAEDPQLVDISELATSSTSSRSGEPLQWRYTGIGDTSLCSTLFSSASAANSNQTGSCLTVNAAETSDQALPGLEENGELENCTVYIFEHDLSGTNMIYEIHTPAVAGSIALSYAIDFVADDGSRFEQDVNLCIHP